MEEQLGIVKNENDRILQFWASKIAKYPKLARIALRIFATTASYYASERDFSLLKRLIVQGRIILADDALEALAYLRSVLIDESSQVEIFLYF